MILWIQQKQLHETSKIIPIKSSVNRHDAQQQLNSLMQKLIMHAQTITENEQTTNQIKATAPTENELNDEEQQPPPYTSEIEGHWLLYNIDIVYLN